MSAMRRFVLRLVSFFRAGQAEAELAREINAHLQLLEDKFLAQGLSASEARSAARRAFGGVEQVKERQRETRSFRWLDEGWLDAKLGARMLIKYPGLTLVGGLGMAVAITIGAVSFEVFYSYMDPVLPLDEGERVVGIENWDTAANNQDRRALQDFVTWRDELKSVEDLGAFRPLGRNLILGNSPAEPVSGAEMSASGFRLARVPPLLGRPLLDQDEREGAPPVVVIGYSLWRTRFASDPEIVGRTIQLGDARYTVVGVMPQGFAFPLSQRFWIPLRANPSQVEPRQGPEVFTFGRLAPGVSLDEAQAELATVGVRMAAAFPQTHERLRPRVVPYAAQFFDDMSRWEVLLTQILITLLLVVVCANVSILVYARTATRQAEIAVRSALGASRGRIVAQLFIEALVLSAGAAVLALWLARLALRPVNGILAGATGGAPFWADYDLSAGTVFYVVGLTVLASVMVGAVPGIKATGRWMQSALRELGGTTGLRLGRTSTGLIVLQVALSVAILPAGVFMGWQSVRHATFDPGFAAEELLMAWIKTDGETPATSRFGNLQIELRRRLEGEPGVSGVTFTSHVPGDETEAFVEIDGVPPPPGAAFGHEIRSLQVDLGFFDTFEATILTGRRFHSGDLDTAAAAVIVNRTFARQLFGEGNALGRRVRYADRRDPGEPCTLCGRWYEIVGVMEDVPAHAVEPGLPEGRLYHPMAPGQVNPVSLAVRVRGAAPTTLAGRLRAITTALDPNLRVQRILPLDELYRMERLETQMAALALGLVALSVLLLSAAGIYALMSFTVAQRRREIGIRAALGAGPRRLLGSIFSRVLGQLAVGIAVGMVAAALLERLTEGGLMGGKGAILLPLVAALMMAVGLLAALGPARRGLRVQPTEALREQ
jgi:putative ABC transport system permease protein